MKGCFVRLVDQRTHTIHTFLGVLEHLPFGCSFSIANAFVWSWTFCWGLLLVWKTKGIRRGIFLWACLVAFLLHYLPRSTLASCQGVTQVVVCPWCLESRSIDGRVNGSFNGSHVLMRNLWLDSVNDERGTVDSAVECLVGLSEWGRAGGWRSMNLEMRLELCFSPSQNVDFWKDLSVVGQNLKQNAVTEALSWMMWSHHCRWICSGERFSWAYW